MRLIFLASCFSAATAALAGCGSDPSTGTPGPVAPSTGSPRATVSLQQYVGSDGYGVTANALFATSSDTSPCPVTTLDDQCEYFACPVTSSSVDAGVTAAYQAGALRIAGPSFPGGGLSLAAPAVGGSYEDFSSLVAAPYFRGGDVITFSAAGDPASVGGFSLSMPAPADAVVTSPLLANGSLALSRGTDLSVTWQPGAAGTSMAVTLYELDANGGARKAVSCVFAAAAGSGTLPSAGGFANFDPIDGTTIKGDLLVLPYAYASTSATAADGTKWSIYGTVGASPVEDPFTLP